MIVEKDRTILQTFATGNRPTSEAANMNSKNKQQTEPDAQRVQANRDELVERIARCIREDGTVEPLKDILLRRSSTPTEAIPVCPTLTLV